MVLESKIYQIISKTLGAEQKDLNPEVNLYEDLNAGQIEIADLLLRLEQEFNIELPKEDFSKIKAVKDILTLIEENSNEMVD